MVFLLFSFLSSFLELHSWHMEVPRLGGHQNYSSAYTTAIAKQDPSAEPHLQPTQELMAMPGP